MSSGTFPGDNCVSRPAAPQEFGASGHFRPPHQISHFRKNLVTADEITEYAWAQPRKLSNRFQGQVVQIADVRFFGLRLPDEESLATDLVMPNFQQIGEPQPRAVGHQQPRSQELAVRHLYATTQVRGYRQQAANIRVRPRFWAGRKPFDTPQGAEYTRVHQSLAGCESQEPSQHTAMVVHRGGCKMIEGLGQVVIDQVGSHLAHLPGQAAAKDFQLFQVAGAATYAVAVSAGEFDQQHEGTVSVGSEPRKCASPSLGAWHRWSRLQNRHNQNKGQLAQLVSCLVLWLTHRRWPILRTLTVLLFALAIWVRWLGHALVFWGVGQFVGIVLSRFWRR